MQCVCVWLPSQSLYSVPITALAVRAEQPPVATSQASASAQAPVAQSAGVAAGAVATQRRDDATQTVDASARGAVVTSGAAPSQRPAARLPVPGTQKQPPRTSPRTPPVTAPSSQRPVRDAFAGGPPQPPRRAVPRRKAGVPALPPTSGGVATVPAAAPAANAPQGGSDGIALICDCPVVAFGGCAIGATVRMWHP